MTWHGKIINNCTYAMHMSKWQSTSTRGRHRGREGGWERETDTTVRRTHSLFVQKGETQRDITQSILSVCMHNGTDSIIILLSVQMAYRKGYCQKGSVHSLCCEHGVKWYHNFWNVLKYTMKVLFTLFTISDVNLHKVLNILPHHPEQ